MALVPLDSNTITHGIQLAVAPVFLFLGETTGVQSARWAVGGFLSGVVCFLLALLCFLAETFIATRLLNFELLER